MSLCLLRRITKAGLCSCVLHRMARVGLCSRVSYTIWQGLVCVLMSLRLSAKGWFEFVSYTGLHDLVLVCVLLCLLE